MLALLTVLSVRWQQRGTEPESSSRLPQESEQQLARLYGRAPYEGVRRTLKTTPYLHFSSPGSPLGRRPRPRLVESIRGQNSRPMSPDLINEVVTCWLSLPLVCSHILSGFHPPTRCKDEVLQDTDQFDSSPESPPPGAGPPASPCLPSCSPDTC